MRASLKHARPRVCVCRTPSPPQKKTKKNNNQQQHPHTHPHPRNHDDRFIQIDSYVQGKYYSRMSVSSCCRSKLPRYDVVDMCELNVCVRGERLRQRQIDRQTDTESERDYRRCARCWRRGMICEHGRPRSRPYYLRGWLTESTNRCWALYVVIKLNQSAIYASHRVTGAWVGCGWEGG